jgi:hypothetical protein
VFQVSPREFTPEISDDHMAQGDEGEYNSNRHVTLEFASNCSLARQTVEKSKSLPGRRELSFFVMKNLPQLWSIFMSFCVFCVLNGNHFLWSPLS